MANKDYIKMTIPAKADYIGVIRLTLSGIANRMGFTYEDIEDLKIGISEAITNAVTHAYNNKEKGEIQIGFGVHDDRLEIMVADRGNSFNVEEVREKVGRLEKSKPLEELQEGGFGLLLIEALMDKVEIHDNNGVIIVMTKYIDENEVGLNGDQVSTTS